jgi:hypothetical protein
MGQLTRGFFGDGMPMGAGRLPAPADIEETDDA